MKIKMKIPGLYIILLLTVLLASCRKDFEEIDTNPQGFTTASDGSLFNGIIQSLVLTGNEQFYINNEILYKQTQQAALTSASWGNYTIGTEDIWANYYKSLPSFRELKKRFDTYSPSPSVTNMEAMLRITLAYKTFKLTDLFGDIPYSEAGYGFQDLTYLHPKYDSQRDIYLSLLGDLEWAAENINDTTDRVEPFVTFASFDKLFNGDLKMWRKFANSMRLRYAMRMSEKEPTIAGEIIKDIIENNLPVLVGYDFTSSVLESACLWPAANGFTNSSVSWSFREHNGLRMGSNIWHQFSGSDEPDGSGIFDPRAYIFFEGDETDKWVAFPQEPESGTPSSQGLPYGSHRDDRDNYHIKSNVNYSPFNFFVIADENFMPIILMTSAEVHYLKAEAYFRGIGVTMDRDMADIEYMNGLNTSVEWWVDLSEKLKLPLSGVGFEEKISIPSNLNVASVLNHFGSWNATTDDEFLGFIYTQRWIDAFRQPWEAYAEVRRTGLIHREGAPVAHFRLPYPPSEAQYNTENWNKAKAVQGGEEPDVKLWWIP
ncbi:MAG: SusD/RagB family nutrient-binding outer membrane lipoprotein [Lentimicrobium sp.]|nr:SusD/RagB family nutrient-binding outer membrane lipoprotein [Lentimicrobium sp.]